MEQTYGDLTQNLKCENENSEMDIEGNVIKVELKPPLTQIQKLPNERPENLNQEEHNDEIKSENQVHDQNQPNENALMVEETIDINLQIDESRSYIYGDNLNSDKKSG